MDYENEPWIKVYTRDTASWSGLSIGARGLSLELSRKMGRFSDEISLGRRGLRAVAGFVNATWDEIEPLLIELIDDGRLIFDPDRNVLRDPDHRTRQGARSSDAQRQRDARARARALTSDDESSRPRVVAAPASDVTPRHELSRAVTRRHDQREEIDQREESERARASAHAHPREGLDLEGPEPEPEPELMAEPPPSPPEDAQGGPLPPRPALRVVSPLPTLDDPLPAPLRARAESLALAAGETEWTPEASWRTYLAWCVEHGHRVNEARWSRWVTKDLTDHKARRVRDRESGVRVRAADPAKAEVIPPYHAPPRLAAPDEEPEAPPPARRPAVRKPEPPRISPEHARATLERLGLAVNLPKLAAGAQ